MTQTTITRQFFHLGGHTFPVGDHLESLLKATGIHQTVKALERATGKDCGCAKRKARLNELGQRLADAWREHPPPEEEDPPP
jgi:hypothetical protein